ncbi:MAG: FHA domain-containing protein [Myxococcales bacterium]|nr:FHA domain-containing protein [Myxococcales bacterium]
MSRRSRTASTVPTAHRDRAASAAPDDDAAPPPGEPGTGCGVCRRDLTGALVCRRCLRRLTVPAGMSSEQIAVVHAESTGAALVDVWGNHHALARTTTIGRALAAELQILHGTISRYHATIAWTSGGWWLTDLRSTNGSGLGATSVTGPVQLRPGQRVAFGDVAMFFVETARSTAGLPGNRDHATATLHAAAPPEALGDSLELVETPSGAGLIVFADGRPEVCLTWMQLELLRALCRRRREDAQAPPERRGFVATTALLGALPWDSVRPHADHVKQLVRRVRRLLADARADLEIESRRHLGYRVGPRG